MAKRPDDGGKDEQGVRHDGRKDEQGVRHDDQLGQFVPTNSTNSEAYFHLYDVLMKGYAEGNRRYPDKNTDDFLFNRMKLENLPSPIRIMDFGGGTGQPLAAIFQKLSSLNKKSIISIEEPHQDYLEKYKMLIEKTSNTCLDIAYPGPLQNYFGKSVEDLMAVGAYPRHPQDRALAIHSFYHAVHTFDRTLDPVQNLEQAVSAMYAILKPGGEMTIALICDEIFLAATLHCLEALYPTLVENFKRETRAFRNVIFDGGVVETLNTWYPNFTAKIWKDEIAVPVVQSSLAEVGAAVTLGCTHGFPGDQSPFDQRILQVHSDFVSKYRSEYGISIDCHGKAHLTLKGIYVTIRKVEKK